MTYDPAVHQRRSIRLKNYDYAQAGAYFITLCTHNRQPFFGSIVRAGLAPAQMSLNEFGQIALEQWHHLPQRFGTLELDTFVVMPNHIHGILVINETTEPAPFMGNPAQIAQNGQPQNGQPQNGQPQNGQPQNGQPQNGQPQNGQPQNGQPQNGQPQNGQPQNGQPQNGQPQNGQPQNGQPQNGQPQNGQPQGLPLRNVNVLTPDIRVTVGNIVGAYKSLVANECLKIYKTKNETMGKLWQRNYYEHIIRNEKSYLKITQYILDNPLKWKLDSLYPGGK